jgi:hypothetical protein
MALIRGNLLGEMLGKTRGDPQSKRVAICYAIPLAISPALSL